MTRTPSLCIGVRILVCGTIPFNKDCQDMLQDMGYPREQVYTF